MLAPPAIDGATFPRIEKRAVLREAHESDSAPPIPIIRSQSVRTTRSACREAGCRGAFPSFAEHRARIISQDYLGDGAPGVSMRAKAPRRPTTHARMSRPESLNH